MRVKYIIRIWTAIFTNWKVYSLPEAITSEWDDLIFFFQSQHVVYSFIITYLYNSLHYLNASWFSSIFALESANLQQPCSVVARSSFLFSSSFSKEQLIDLLCVVARVQRSQYYTYSCPGGVCSLQETVCTSLSVHGPYLAGAVEIANYLVYAHKGS